LITAALGVPRCGYSGVIDLGAVVPCRPGIDQHLRFPNRLWWLSQRGHSVALRGVDVRLCGAGPHCGPVSSLRRVAKGAWLPNDRGHADTDEQSLNMKYFPPDLPP
jgi:hypothetical protein